MGRIEVQPRLLPARRRAHGHASSRGATVQWVEISLRQPAQMPRLQPYASAVRARRKTPTTEARRQYRCDRCPPLQSPAVGSTHKPEPSALPAHYYARHRAKRERSPSRKIQMLLSAPRQTRESLLRRGKKAKRPLDMGSVDPGGSVYGSRVCATRRGQDRWARPYKGYSRVAARAHPKRIDECHHLNPAASAEMQDATPQPGRAR